MCPDTFPAPSQWSHKLHGGTSRIAQEALVAGGATQAEAQALVQESLHDLAQQGVIAPTRIPWQE
jgi:hypothetical protein